MIELEYILSVLSEQDLQLIADTPGVDRLCDVHTGLVIAPALARSPHQPGLMRVAECVDDRVDTDAPDT